MVNFDQFKYDMIYHFSQDSYFDIRINPFDKYTLEEEMLLIMYIGECIPWMETYHSDGWDEVIIKKVDPIPATDMLFYYRKRGEVLEAEVNKLYKNIRDLILSM